MQKLATKIFVIVILTILSIPAIFVILGIKVQPANKNEKKISLNFTRNFPLKADIYKVYSHLKTEVFDTDPLPKEVIEVDNGWKFLGNNFGNALSESKGLVVFSKDEIKALKKRLLERQQWFDEQNIKFYIAMPQNKHTFYSDLIPIKQYDRNTKMKQLDSLCKAIGVNFMDLGKQIPKDSKNPHYYKTDTHWNHHGAYYAYLETMKAFKRDFKNGNFIDFTLDDMVSTRVDTKIGDLNVMLMSDEVEISNFLNFKAPETFKKLDKQLPLPAGYNLKPDDYESRYQNDSINNDLKLLIFNDSFMGFYSEYLIRNFNYTTLIWDHTFNKELIAREQPDIVYYELLERDIDWILEK